MKIITAIALFITLSVSTACSADYDYHKAALYTLQPSLNSDDLNELSEAIKMVSNECEIPWQILVSIAFNESSLKKTAVNLKTLDFGLSQISIKMIKSMKLDIYKLLHDPVYNLTASCKILSYNKKVFSKKYPYWIGIYRSGTALWKNNIRQNAVSYDKIIIRTAKLIGYKHVATRK